MQFSAVLVEAALHCLVEGSVPLCSVVVLRFLGFSVSATADPDG